MPSVKRTACLLFKGAHAVLLSYKTYPNNFIRAAKHMDININVLIGKLLKRY